MLTFRRDSQSKGCSHLHFSKSLAIPLTEDRGLWLRDDINIIHQIQSIIINNIQGNVSGL